MKRAEITERIIGRDVGRGTKFLRTLGTNARIRALLTPRGYTEEEHLRLWSLLLILMGYKPRPGGGEVTAVANAESLAFVDNSDGPTLRLLRVVLEDRHPDQYVYITHDLTPQTGAKSIPVLQQIVDTYAALRDGTDPSREATRDADREVAALLASRCVLNPEIEANFRDHLKKSTAIAPALDEPAPMAEQTKYDDAAAEFHTSIQEWREIARQTITRRDYQIALGLAERRKPGKTGGDDDDDDDDGGGRSMD